MRLGTALPAHLQRGGGGGRRLWAQAQSVTARDRSASPAQLTAATRGSCGVLPHTHTRTRTRIHQRALFPALPWPPPSSPRAPPYPTAPLRPSSASLTG